MNTFPDKPFYINQHFKDLDLPASVFEDREFDNCLFIKCNLSDVQFKNCKFYECTFTDCNLSLLKVNGCSFTDVEFESCKAIGINWTAAAWSRLKLKSPFSFKECILNDSTFFGLSISEIKMINCKAHDVDFQEADCSHADFSSTDFHNSLFNKTNLTEANFSDAVNYNINIYFNEIKHAKFTLPDVMNLLNSLDIEIN